MPLAALHAPTDVRVVSMGVARYGEEFEKRIDPRGRAYYWATNEPPPPPSDEETDLSALSKGFVTLTPLHYDLTKRTMLEEMSSWNFRVSP
jgi:5'-nucleotidase